MSITRLTQWFGTFGMHAEQPGLELGKLEWAGIPFAGSMCEIPHIKARTIIANDLHPHLINYALVIAHPELGRKLRQTVCRLPLHAKVLEAGQRYCIAKEKSCVQPDLLNPDLEWAINYHVATWMGRASKAGTKGEFKGGLSVRYEAGGGDSAVRWSNAGRGIAVWRRIFIPRVTFSCIDGFKFLAKCKDQEGHGLYLDPTFPDAGDPYKFKLDLKHHEQLASDMAKMKRTRVVMRFYDHPLIRKLYSAHRWNWRFLEGRKQTNETAPEVLLINGESYVDRKAAA